MPDTSSTPNMTAVNVSPGLLANEVISLMTPFFLYTACLTARTSTSAQHFLVCQTPDKRVCCTIPLTVAAGHLRRMFSHRRIRIEPSSCIVSFACPCGYFLPSNSCKFQAMKKPHPNGDGLPFFTIILARLTTPALDCSLYPLL